MDINNQVEEVLAKYPNLVFDPFINCLEGPINIIADDRECKSEVIESLMQIKDADVTRE